MLYLFAIHVAVGVALVDYVDYLYPHDIIF